MQQIEMIYPINDSIFMQLNALDLQSQRINTVDIGLRKTFQENLNLVARWDHAGWD